MNKQSNTYTLIYIILLVTVVGSALAWVATALKPEQTRNANADKMKQILAAVHCTPTNNAQATETFDSRITGIIINDKGDLLSNETAFDINVAQESRLSDHAERLLPVYIYKDDAVGTKYIIPLYGQGLWGPIWGYLALNDNGSTIYGAYFSHQGETPGLGAEIEKPEFQNRFDGKQLFKNDTFMPVTVVKAGQHPQGDEDYVDGISGGTITSKGVAAMLQNCLEPYKAYLKSLNQTND
ncbi:MAG: NADH:ubiquinone reductase (Na(+)-transporting) subunit C [Muribaculaceae bacterium]|nr:NADH:ubiquinone reductase (Na(+)-transporting) subunit C [Muribaculaceae bacterium]